MEENDLSESLLSQSIHQKSQTQKKHKLYVRQPLQKMEDNELSESSQAQSVRQRSHVSQKKQHKFPMRKPLQGMEDIEPSDSSHAQSIHQISHVSRKKQHNFTCVNPCRKWMILNCQSLYRPKVFVRDLMYHRRSKTNFHVSALAGNGG